MPLIYAIIDPFIRYQKICLREPTGETKTIGMAELKEFTKIIPQLCEEYKIKDVHFYGSVDYLTKIAEEIQINNKIKIEVE